jgi:hypothetical protein
MHKTYITQENIKLTLFDQLFLNQKISRMTNPSSKSNFQICKSRILPKTKIFLLDIFTLFKLLNAICGKIQPKFPNLRHLLKITSFS